MMMAMMIMMMMINGPQKHIVDVIMAFNRPKINIHKNDNKHTISAKINNEFINWDIKRY